MIHALRKERCFDTRTILTGQHRQMTDQVVKLFRLPVDTNLNLMREDQTLASLSGRLLNAFREVFEKFRPNLVLVQGDTTTAFMAALCSFYNRIPVAHVEAGLRSCEKYQPFPEEINRRLISHLSDFHFAPTDSARKNLLREGIAKKQIAVTGNTVIDALYWMRRHLASSYPRFRKVDFSKRVILLTAHRRENIGQPLIEITQAVKKLIARFSDIEVVYPVHLNPGVQRIVRRNLDGEKRVHLFPPIRYDETVFLMNHAYLILTDSGGIQEEAPSLGKPLLVLREVSERPEGVKAGALKIVGTGTSSIVREASRLLTSKRDYWRMARVRNVYGDGKAAARIVRKLKDWLV